MINNNIKPYEWSEKDWMAKIENVRAGKRFAPKQWKNAAKCAVALSFDIDQDTSELRLGAESICRLSSAHYGARAGLPRILKLLRKYEIPASMYVPAVVAKIYPEDVKQMVEDGHEIGLHGWIHEYNSMLDEKTERELFDKAIDVLTEISGKRPVGIRTPAWDFSPYTMQIAIDAGLLYDSSLMADDDIYEINHYGKPTGLYEMPVEWIRDDALYLAINLKRDIKPLCTPHDFLEILKKEFDGAYREGGIFQLTCHPHVSGYRSRIWVLEELIKYINQHEDIWYATHEDIVRYAVNL